MNAQHTLAGIDRTGALEALVRSHDLRKALQILSFVVLGTAVGALLLVGAATVPILFGYHTYTLHGGSMEPTLSDGSVAVTHPTSPRALIVGDIIAYRSSPENAPVLHRIVSITTGAAGEPLFTTQGDSNLAADPRPVGLTGPGDKVVYSVPYAGYILSFARSGLGIALLIGVPLVALAFASVRDAFRKRMEQRARVWVEPAAPIEAAPRQRPQAELQPIATFQARPPPAPATPSAGTAAELPAFLASQLRAFAADPVARPAPFSPRAARPHEREHQDHRAA